MTPVLLHSCCAPCSAAILEWMVGNGYAPTVIFYNPNIYPEEEYLKRKNEIVRYCQTLNIHIVDYDGWEGQHTEWLNQTQSLSHLGERSQRCLICFKIRLATTAKYASENGFKLFTTSLASSRWKDFEQIKEAGYFASALYPNTEFWDKNWRKGGLYERRNQLSKQFYNQQYCGCEFSIRKND